MGRSVVGRLLFLQSSLCLPSSTCRPPCISFSFKRSLPPLLLLSQWKSEQHRLRSRNERLPLQQQSRTELLLAAPLITLTRSRAFLSLSRRQALCGSSRHSHAPLPFRVGHLPQQPPRKHVRSLPSKSTVQICSTIFLRTF